jgi:hypothetical protein
VAGSDVQSASWLHRRIVPTPTGGYLQVVPSDGGRSLHDAAHDAASIVAVHFGGSSPSASGTVVICPQQIGADDGQSDAVEHASVAPDEQEAGAEQELLCEANVAQHTWLPLQRTRFARGPQLGPTPASMGAATSGPASRGAETSATPPSTGGGDDWSPTASAPVDASSDRASLTSAAGCDASSAISDASLPGGSGIDASFTVVGPRDVPSQSSVQAE